MDAFFPESPDPAGGEGHQLLVGRVVADELPALNDLGSDLVDPLVKDRADDIGMTELAADREVDNEVELVLVALHIQTLVLRQRHIERHAGRPRRSRGDLIGDDSQVEVRRLLRPLPLDSLYESVRRCVTDYEQVNVAVSRPKVTEPKRAMENHGRIREHSPAGIGDPVDELHPASLEPLRPQARFRHHSRTRWVRPLPRRCLLGRDSRGVRALAVDTAQASPGTQAARRPVRRERPRLVLRDGSTCLARAVHDRALGAHPRERERRQQPGLPSRPMPFEGLWGRPAGTNGEIARAHSCKRRPSNRAGLRKPGARDLAGAQPAIRPVTYMTVTPARNPPSTYGDVSPPGALRAT